VLTTDTRVLRNVGGHFSFYIQNVDGPEWGGMNIYTSDTSTNVLNAGFGSIDSGSVIQVTGKLTKYGSDAYGNFELTPIGSATVQPIPVNILQISARARSRSRSKLATLYREIFHRAERCTSHPGRSTRTRMSSSAI